MQQMINEQICQSKFTKLLDSFKLFDFINDDNENNDENNDEIFRFVTKNIDFFDFNYENKSIFTNVLFENINNETMFRNIHVFVDRTKNFINTQKIKLMRNNLFKYLKNDVLM